MRENIHRGPSSSHPAYRRLADRPSPHPRPEPRSDRCTRPDPAPRHAEICPDCDAPRSCCHCRADIADLRRFARRMAELHQHTGNGSACGCGAFGCYIRRRLDDIGHGETR